VFIGEKERLVPTLRDICPLTIRFSGPIRVSVSDQSSEEGTMRVFGKLDRGTTGRWGRRLNSPAMLLMFDVGGVR
jgi:hypothetical protein